MRVVLLLVAPAALMLLVRAGRSDVAGRLAAAAAALGLAGLLVGAANRIGAAVLLLAASGVAAAVSAARRLSAQNPSR